jgi:hypothetical protein
MLAPWPRPPISTSAFISDNATQLRILVKDDFEVTDAAHYP